ncbi:hypothetical protein [Deferribacter abyssi]|uniref:hypothetical protein n=1 Tax=Deferribacter abyssi TaxID=213806 RepID=UPI003C27D56E
MIKESLKVKGFMSAVLVKQDGRKEVIMSDNLILSVGFDFICDAIAKSTQPAPMGYIAVGTDSTAVDPAQTGLVNEIARKAATYGHTAGTKSFTLTATFDAGEATGALVEAGVVNAATGGIFLDRVTFPVINKETNDMLTVTFTFTLS